MEIHLQVTREEAHDDEDYEQDEKMVPTPQDQKILLQQLGGDDQGNKDETQRPFEEDVSEKLEEIQQQLDQSLQTILTQQVAQFKQRLPTPQDQQDQQENQREEQ